MRSWSKYLYGPAQPGTLGCVYICSTAGAAAALWTESSDGATQGTFPHTSVAFYSFQVLLQKLPFHATEVTVLSFQHVP